MGRVRKRLLAAQSKGITQIPCTDLERHVPELESPEGRKPHLLCRRFLGYYNRKFGGDLVQLPSDELNEVDASETMLSADGAMALESCSSNGITPLPPEPPLHEASAVESRVPVGAILRQNPPDPVPVDQLPKKTQLALQKSIEDLVKMRMENIQKSSDTAIDWEA